MVKVVLPVAPDGADSLISALRLAAGTALYSLSKVEVAPSSATASTPAVAVPPAVQNVTLLLWTAPISVVK